MLLSVAPGVKIGRGVQATVATNGDCRLTGDSAPGLVRGERAGRREGKIIADMTPVHQRPSLEWRDWLASASGRYMTDRELAWFDAAVGDLFGYYAMQLGFAHLDGLRASRMPTRILALARAEPGTDAELRADLPPFHCGGRHAKSLAEPLGAGGDPNELAHEFERAGVGDPLGPRSEVILERFEELPFGDQSVDLLLLPHVLEFAEDPHQVLREADRILRPEGRLFVTGLNPLSLWRARQSMPERLGGRFMPREVRFLGLPRLRDWVRLLSFEIESERYGCYRPASSAQTWLDRTAFMEELGDRFWPICGAVYLLSAVKRVRSMRLLGPAWRRPAGARAGGAVAVSSCVEAPIDASSDGGSRWSIRR